MASVVAGGHRLETQWVRGREGGDARRPVLVFLHEGLGSVALWKDFPRRVVEATGCPALVYSRYGYGQSEPLAAPHRVDYMHREALDVLPELLGKLAVADPILIGHSDGASIALIYAGAARWPVRGLVAMAPHVFVEDLTISSIAQAKVAFDTTDLRGKLGRYHADVDSAFRGWNDIWLQPAFRAWSIEDRLPGIACPVLLIQGQDDRYGSMAQIDAIERQVRGSVRTLKLPGCGHSPHVDQPERTLQAIASFVQELCAA